MKKLAFSLLCMVCLLSASAMAADRERVGVMKFQNSAGVEGGYALTIGDTFAQMLAFSEKLSVMGPDQMMSIATQNNVPMSGYISRETATEIGKLAGCRYVVVGTVTDFKRTSKVSGVWIAASHKEQTTAEADLRVYDVQTGETVISESASGRAAQGGSFVSIYGISSGTADISGTDAAVISELTSKLSIIVRDKLVDDSPKVTEKSSKEVTLNLGTIGGANKGGLFRIYAGSGKSQQNLAIVRVKDAKSDYSTAELADKSSGNLSLVQKGDKIYPINATEVKSIQKKGFAKSRPRVSEVSSEKFDDIMKPSTKETSFEEAKSEVPAQPSASEYENESTDPEKVIATYGLSSSETSVRKLAHKNAAKLGNKSKKAYDKYVELAESYENDYLAAYRAGVIARHLKRKNDAVKWLDRALEINPDYVPAQEARAKL